MPAARRRIGALERAARKTIRELADTAGDRPEFPALSQYALHMARLLDEGAGLAAAAVGREYRAAITALAQSGADDDDDTRQLVARLAAPLVVPGHTAN